MSILQEIVLRHRAEGYLRFALPALLCESARVKKIEWALQQNPAVVSARVYGRDGKLVIRYLAGAADLLSISALLKEVVMNVDSLVMPSVCCAESSGAGLVSASDRNLESGFSGWVRDKSLEIRETITAFGIVFRKAFGWNSQQSLLKHSDLTDFLTDILVLYLIRLHWHAITQFWLKRPWLYRYEWMATVYMIFLLVRSKRPKD
jgi:hypothetical protein